MFLNLNLAKIIVLLQQVIILRRRLPLLLTVPTPLKGERREATAKQSCCNYPTRPEMDRGGD